MNHQRTDRDVKTLWDNIIPRIPNLDTMEVMGHL